MGLMVDRSEGKGREQVLLLVLLLEILPLLLLRVLTPSHFAIAQVAELSVSAVGFVTQQGRLVSPRQEKILASTTV